MYFCMLRFHIVQSAVGLYIHASQVVHRHHHHHRFISQNHEQLQCNTNTPPLSALRASFLQDLTHYRVSNLTNDTFQM